MRVLTSWERAVLIGMYLAAFQAKEPLQMEFTRRSLEHIVWFDWQGYHTKRIEKLVIDGWLREGKTEEGLIAYKMTKAAHGCISIDLGNCLANARYIPAAQLDLFDMGE